MMASYQTDPLIQNYLAPSYPIFIQMRNIIQSLTVKKALRKEKQDIQYLASKIGPEGQQFALTTLLQIIDIRQFKQKSQSNIKIILLSELLKDFSNMESFLSYFPQIINTVVIQPSKYSEYFSVLLMATKLPIPNQITMALSLYLHDKKELSEVGQIELERKLKEFKVLNKRGSQLPQRVLDELLFQINQNTKLQEKLNDQYEHLLMTSSQKIDKVPSIRIHHFLNNEWQFFASQTPIIEKVPPITIKKVDLLRDLGPAATGSPQILKISFSQLGAINQQEALDCLLMMSEQRSNCSLGVQKFVTEIIVANKKGLKSEQLKKIYLSDLNSKKGQILNWNIDNFIQFCSQTVPTFKWQNVYLQLDRPNLQFKTQQMFLTFMKYLEKIRKQANNKFKIPDQIYFKKWNNSLSQTNFLINVFKCKQPQVFGFSDIPNRKIQKTVKDGNIVVKQMWGYLDLIQILIQISDYNYLEIRELFDIPMTKYPELLLQTLSEIRPIKGQAMLDQLFSQLFPSYLHNHSTNIRLLENLWEANQDLVIATICQLYKSESKKQNSLNLSRVLDIAQVIKESLIPLTNWNDYQFAVPLAILAGKRQFLHFEPWITQRIKNAGNPFLKATLAYIEDHLIIPIRKYNQSNQHYNYEIILQKAQLNKQLLAFIFQSIFLTTSSNKMTKRNLQSLKRIYKEVCIYFPQMSQSQMPDEIEQLAQRQFIKIYKKQITIEEAIQHMRKLKNSQKTQQKQLFASMITFMYSQLRFHVSYPQNQLLITADLFSGIINNGLIDKKLIQVLLQVLEDDLKQDNKKYIFARLVIEKIKGKLANEAEFCQKLLDINNLLQKDPQLIQTLIKCLEPPINLSIQKQKKLKQAIKLKNSPPQPVILIPNQEEQIQQKKIQTYDYDILTHFDRSKQISQSLGQKDNRLTKINTICNTLSLSNIDQKAKDLQKIIDSNSTILLLSYNIVFKRIPLSAHNNSGVQIFYRLVEKIPKIQHTVKKLTYKILQAWFSLTEKSVNDKKLGNFKSLAFWLGKLTIGKGTPILINKINIRQILVNSYTHHPSRLALNISVILKLLEQIVTFKDIFRVNNPWLGRILGTLNEIEQKIKQDFQNTKSEIKGFFINTDIKKSSNLFSVTYLDKSDFPLISRLPEYIKICQDLHTYYKNKGIDLKMLITKAVDDSIQEIVQPVIDRAVKIAIVTAKQLIFKDFALESNAEKFKISFSNVVKKLAGPLAQVTCREPLKTSMSRILKSYLSKNIQDKVQVQNIISKAIPDNLDLGCALIKKAVIQSAQEAIRKDQMINESIEQRNNAVSHGKPFRDESYLQQIPEIVPEDLRPKIGGLSLQQFLVYDQFRKQKAILPSQLIQVTSNLQKLNDTFNQKGPVKTLKELLCIDNLLRQQLLQKVYLNLKQAKEQNQMEYYIQVCEMLKQFIQPQDSWTLFKEKCDISKKQIRNLVRKLVRQKIFEDSCLSQIDDGNEQQQKAINMFQKWLDTARQQIEPFLQNLQQTFNKSQNQIKTFFIHSLNYSLQKVQNSMSSYHTSIDTTYIEDYSKLIIISYKLIANNNSNLFLQDTLQAILQIFNRIFNKENKVNHQRSFFKLFLNLICDATRKQYDFHKDKITYFYFYLATYFHKINPMLYSSFSFSWLQLISNKYFMPTLLEKYQYWDVYFELISDIFKYAKEQITEEALNQNPPCQIFYKGIIRIIIILIHDFPDFLSAFSLQLCLNIPEKFIQIKNIVLSAYPSQLKFRSPKAILNRQQLQKQSNISNLPKYYKVQFDKQKYNQFISLFQNNDKSLRAKLQAQNDMTLQLFVLYFSWLQQCQLSVTNSRKLLLDIMISLDGELKEKLIKFAINLIRYPNSVTIFFIDFVTALVFKNVHEKTRNLLLAKMFQRINVQSSHPWGMLYLVNQFQIQKNQLTKLQIPKEILNRL